MNDGYEKLNELMQMLNEDQLTAVKAISGPVVAIAGPGTGKTTLLSTRIGYIITNTDTAPHNILCVTFSEAGKTAMKRKLVQYYGVIGHRIHVYTFHGFCNKVLQENPELIGIQDMQPAGEMDLIRITREILDELDNDHPLKRIKGNRYFEEKPLRNAWSLMKGENWTEEDVFNATQLYIEDLPGRDEYIYKRGNSKKGIEAGDPKVDLINKEAERMQKLNCAAELLCAYQEKLKDNKIYDFDDMLGIVTNSFDQYSYLLRRYQEQYLYFLVDEFQDTNGIQFKLLNQLIGYWDVPNVFVVGDDDQSIFEFQGARIKNLTDFMRKYPTMNKVFLKTNYRSTQQIIDCATSVIKNNDDRLEKAEFKGTNHIITYPKVHEFNTRAEEISWIVNHLKEHSELSEVAIIYSKHRQVNELMRLLNGHNIAFNSSRQIDVLTSSIARILHLLMEVFMSDKLPGELAPLYYRVAMLSFIPSRVKNLYRKIAKSKDKALPTLMSDTLFRKFCDEAFDKRATLGFHSFVAWLIRASGLAEHCIRQGNGVIKLQMLRTLYNFIEEYSLKNPFSTFEQYIEAVNSMIENNVMLPTEVIIKNEAGCHLLTSHASKGLEFMEVIMLDCTDAWEPGRGSAKYKIPDTLSHASGDTSEEAARRAFYVAMTRARGELFMTYAKQGDGKELTRAIFIDESECDIQHIEVKPEVIQSTYESVFRISNDETTLIDGLNVKDKVDNFTWSVSALNTFIDCAWGFYCNYLLRIPSANIQAMVYGEAMHQALYLHVLNMRRSGGKDKTLESRSFGSLEDLVAEFKTFLTDQAGDFTEKEFEAFMLRGENNLRWYFDQGTWVKSSRAEQSIRDVEINGIPIKGVLDRMDFMDELECTIIDYKTGTYKSEYYKPGGHYWRQGIFYFLLLNNQQREGWFSKKVVFDYIEPQYGKHIQKEIHLTPEDMEAVTIELTEADKTIKNLDFSHRCGKCKWCELKEDLLF